jgi:hypothetical protein
MVVELIEMLPGTQPRTAVKMTEVGGPSTELMIVLDREDDDDIV